MTMTALGPVDGYSFLYRLQYTDTAYYRFADAPYDVTIAGDGIYRTAHPILAVDGLGDTGPRIEERTISLSIADPQRTYENAFSLPNVWFGRLLDVFFIPSPGAAPRRLEHVSLRARGFIYLGEGEDRIPCTVLRYATPLMRQGSTKVRMTNPETQREADPLDDGMDQAQTTIDVVWGSRARAGD